jgi:CubicO group peptidase (beta-lactamase class C family)
MRVLADSGFSGVVLVARGNTILLHRSYDHKGFSADTSMAFFLASNSKQFTATAILRLQEQGKLSVHDRITRFFAKVPPDKKGITIHHLLTHASGIGNNYISEGITDRSEMVRQVLSRPLEQPIGKEYAYTSDGYNLLGAIIEIASGMTFEKYLTTYLLKPAGLHHTGFWGFQSEVPVRIAPVLDSVRSKPLYQKAFRNDTTYANWGMRGAGGMFSTAIDLFHWVRAIQGRRVIADSSRQQMWAPHVLIRQASLVDVYSGYGWIVSTTKDGKLVETRHSGREDWMANSWIRVFRNGDLVIALAYDFGPDADAMSVMAAKELVLMLKQHSRQ